MEYNREAAVAYAREWALLRNPAYYDFEDIGGDCTNFASQVLYAGAGVMNFTQYYGWYYISPDDRAPAWTSVEYFARFLTTNEGVGPYGSIRPLYEALPGDFIQLSFDGVRFGHTLVVLETGEFPTPDNILTASHTYDSLDRAVDTYNYMELRLIHIEGVREETSHTNHMQYSE
ncbi:MAG: amidase domain-containing protein [Oscillospiraceae bacterium]|nr:amidase domain-containing protein [Oscillospiraceae bacterium]